MSALAQIGGWILGAAFTGEFLGYMLHRLLHAGWIRWLTYSHMEHHMVLYGPLQKQRPSEHYMDATTVGLSVGNVGLEWLVPSIALLALTEALLWLLRVRVIHQVVFIATILAWSFVMFSYLHDRMHIRNCWMERNPILKRWFRRARQLHDIHHRVLNDGGLMNKNFGIGFFLFDRVFGSMCMQQRSFNRHGYELAVKRFGVLMSGKHKAQMSTNADHAGEAETQNEGAR